MDALRFGAALAALATLSATAAATHGDASLLHGDLSDGRKVALRGEYVEGSYDEQVWLFDFLVEASYLTCLAFGSVEIGFLAPDCEFEIDGTGHEHEYPNTFPDVHDVAFRYGALTATLQQVVVR